MNEPVREVVEAKKFNCQHATSVKIDTREPMGLVSGIEPKNWISGTITSEKGERQRLIKMVEKRGPDLHNAEFPVPIFTADDFFRSRNILRDAGIPTLDTVRKVDEYTVLISDLTADGCSLYGKGLAQQLDENIRFQDKQIELTENDRQFMNVDLNEVERLANDYADLAADQHVQLPLDDPFELRVYPDGHWNLISLDVRNAAKQPEYLKNRLREYNKTSVRTNLMASLWYARNEFDKASRGIVEKRINIHA